MQFNKLPLLLMLLLWACSEKEDLQQDIPVTSEIATSLVSEIKIDSVSLVPEKYSGLGRLELINNKIVYQDLVEHTVNFLDENLKLEGVYGGKGNGPNEVQNINYITNAPGSSYLMIDNFGFNLFENDSSKLEFKLYDWDSQTPSQELLARPNAEDKGMYSIDWKPHLQTNFSSTSSDHLFIPIITEHPNLNAFQNAGFYEKTYAVGKFNLNSGKLEQIGVQWPSVYLNHQFIPNLASIDLSFQNERLTVGFMIDSLLHVYDENLKLLEKFGVSGQGMNMDYRRTRTIDEALDNWKADLSEQSYYSSIFNHEKRTFRVYHPYGTSGETRMQVYTDQVLTHDVRVPKRFRVIGKLGEYYYADGHISESDDSLFIYRFKLND